MLTKKVFLFLMVLIMGSVQALPTVNCWMGREGDYEAFAQLPLYNGYPFKMDVVGTTLDGGFIEGRVEARTIIQYGQLIPFRTTLYINLFEVTARDQFLLVIPFGRSYFQRISFEGHELTCRIL